MPMDGCCSRDMQLRGDEWICVNLRVWDRKFVMMSSSCIHAWPMCFGVKRGVNEAFL